MSDAHTDPAALPAILQRLRAAWQANRPTLQQRRDDLQRLRAALEGSAEHFHGDVDAYVSCDLVFHQCLIDAAHNPALSELYRYFSGVVAAALQHNMTSVPRCQATFDLHGQILDAIEQRDPERAKRLSRTLIES